MSQHLFRCYLALLCWVPLPLASKAPLAQDVFILLVSALSIAVTAQALLRPRLVLAPALARAWPAAICFALLLGWLVLQQVPLPLEWIRILSPARSQVTSPFSSDSTLALSFYAWGTWHQLLLSAAYAQLFFLTLALVDSESRLRTLLYTVLVLGTLQALYGSLMTLTGIEKQLWYPKEAHLGAATGTLLNRNHLANYLTFAAAAGIGLLLASARLEPAHNWRQFLRNLLQWLVGSNGPLRLALLILVIGLVLTRSRMGTVAFFSSLSVAALTWALLTRKLNSSLLALFGSLLLVDILLAGGWFGLDQIAERIERGLAQTELRQQMTPYLLAMAKDFWLTGTGAGTFADVFPLYKQQLTTVRFNEAHNDYLQFFIELGIIGSLPLLTLVASSLYQCIQTIRTRHSRLLVASGFSTLMALLACGLHATVEYNLQRPATATLFVVFLALPWASAHLVSNGRRHSRSNHRKDDSSG